MNHQPANTYPNSCPDARIEQVLEALRTTEPPTGLEQRIAARLAQAAEARSLKTEDRTATPPFFAVILTLSRSKGKDPRILLAPANLYIAAGTALTVVIALTILHHHPSANSAQTNFNSHSNPIAQEHAAISPQGAELQSRRTPSFEGAGLQSRQTAPASNLTLTANGISSPLPRSAQDPSAQDLDALALAETLAPSRPAPPMPLTAQEKLIRSATRPGQPIQLAELDLARAPVLRAQAEARQTASIEHYVRSLLAPFAASDALQPTATSQPTESSPSASVPPTTNPSN